MSSDSLCICGHAKIWHVQGHYSCNPLGVACDCVEFQFAPPNKVLQSDEAVCTAKYHLLLAEKGDTVCGVCSSPLRR